MLQDFINQFNGQNGVGDTPQNDGQCVGLVEKWFDTIGSPHVWGNACDLPTNAPRNAYDVIYNAPDNYPAQGDVLCFQAGWEGSGVGHTLVVVSADVNSFSGFEQNDRLGGGDGSCRIWHFANYSGVIGWIHPHVLDVPAPQPAPVPVEVPVPVETLAPDPTPPEPTVEPTPLPVEPPQVPVVVSPSISPATKPSVPKLPWWLRFLNWLFRV